MKGYFREYPWMREKDEQTEEMFLASLQDDSEDECSKEQLDQPQN